MSGKQLTRIAETIIQAIRRYIEHAPKLLERLIYLIKNLIRPIFRHVRFIARAIYRELPSPVKRLLRKAKRSVIYIAVKMRKLLSPIFKKLSLGLQAVFNPLWRIIKTRWNRLSPPTRLSLGVFALFIIVLSGFQLYKNSWYSLSPSSTALLTKSIARPDQLKKTKDGISFNSSEQRKAGQAAQYVVAASSLDSTGEAPYQATLPNDPSKGITFADAKGELSFNLTPEFKVLGGKEDDGRMVYPINSDISQVYTLKRNGIKEDIILDKAPRSGKLSFSWKINTGDKLEARLEVDGSVGIYATDGSSVLSGDISIGDSKSQELIDKARKNQAKTELKFVLPKPYIVDSSGHKRFEGVTFSLKDNVLTLNVSGLRSPVSGLPDLKYPISIDPSIVVTTTAELRTGNDDGAIDYATANQINRAALTEGVTTWGSTSTIMTARRKPVVVAYNGYLYLTGGTHATSDTACATVSSTSCSDVQYAAVNADGTVGAWHYTHDSTDDGTSFVSGFTTARGFHGSIAYNGYLYIVGGSNNTPTYFNDVQYAPINSDGTIGTWNTTTSFSVARSGHGTVVYNGYLYITAGVHASSDTLCNSSANIMCSDVQYALICTGSNSGVGGCGATAGTVGTWARTTSISNARVFHTSVAYNGYLYVIGGCITSGVCSGFLDNVDFASINADGTIGTWIATTSFNTARSEHGSAVYNGYLYIMGGKQLNTDTACSLGASQYCSDVQYAPINSDGSIGAWSTTTNFTTPRQDPSVLAYNGYVYVIAGNTPTPAYLNDVRYAPLSASGALVSATYGTAGSYSATTDLTDARSQGAAFAYNSYIYIVGGISSSAILDTVEYAPINSDGTIGSWTATTSLSTAVKDLTSIVYNGYVYVIGGCTVGVAYTCSALSSDVQYAPINRDGSIGSWSATTSLSTARSGHTSVAYNGYIYAIGGCSAGACTSYESDVQYAPINSNGTIGTWSATTSFSTARSGHTSIAYNGYLYVIGGIHATSDTACHTSANVRCSDIQYAPINSNGTIGTWGTTNSLTRVRSLHASVAYNGYLYSVGNDISGGFDETEYAIINSNGTIGTGALTSSLAQGRDSHSTVAFNGYLYVMAGNDTGNFSDVQYSLLQAMPNQSHYERTIDTGSSNTSLQDFTINGTAVCQYTVSYATASATGDGARFVYSQVTTRPLSAGTTVSLGNIAAHYLRLSITLNDQNCGTQSTITDITLNYNYVAPDAPNLISPAEGPSLNTWSSTTSFTTARNSHTSVAYNGYLYVIGGSNGSYQNGVQYAQINSNGTVGAWIATTAFTVPRSGHTSVAYNGYLYIMGGGHSASNTLCNPTASIYCSDVQYAPINSNGTVGNWQTTTNFTGQRQLHTTVVHNGYLYVIGGSDGANLNTVQYAPINTNGSVGTWTATNTFTTARFAHTSVAYNGYMYVVGGSDGATFLSNVQYAFICDGTATGGCSAGAGNIGKVGTWTATTSLTPERGNHTSVANNGYLYVMGGSHNTSDTACNTSSSFLCNDTQYALICTGSNNGVGGCGATAGTVGTWSTTTNFTTGRTNHTSVAYNGYLYVVGGTSGGNLATVQVSQLSVTTLPVFHAFGSQSQSSYLRYKFELCNDINCNSLVRNFDQSANQTGWSGQDTQSTTAYLGSTYPEKSTIATNAYTAPALNAGTTYYWRAYVIDPAISNLWSLPSKTAGFVTDYTTSVPALLSPANGAVNVPTLPTFQMAASDPTSDYLRYKIEVCSTSNCSSVVRTIDQTSSQTGWQGQGTQTGTAYTSNPIIGLSQVAFHQYQTTALSTSTQYWWRAYSIDPGGSNTFSAASGISTFTTSSTSPNVQLRGGIQLRGGTSL